MERFVRRFAFASDAVLMASTHSMDPAEYMQGKRQTLRRLNKTEKVKTSVLILGNHFEHKGLLPALEALVGPDFDITVFGAELKQARREIDCRRPAIRREAGQHHGDLRRVRLPVLL